MATMQVECPTCAAILELDAAHRDREVECGSCEAVFVAKPRRSESSKRVEAKRPRDGADQDEDDRDHRERRKPRKKSKKRQSQRDDERSERTHYGDAGLAVGFISLLLFWCPIGPPITLLGIIISAVGLRSAYPGTAIFGLIMNILMFIFSLLMLLVFRHAANQAGIMPQP
jgi:DNA-directed RNA polymerase subunit M/transcription elongation factor TFIIS